MQQRVQSAMQRIGELESILSRDPSMRGSPVRGGAPAQGGPPMLGGSLGAMGGGLGAARSPLRAGLGGLDDVRVTAKDKSRRGAAGYKPSPRAGAGRIASPGPDRCVPAQQSSSGCTFSLTRGLPRL